MEMMKALVYEKPGRPNGKIKMIPRPVCGDNDVIMKVMSCGICNGAEGSHDRDTGSLMGKYPATPGHEFSGIVDEVGKNVFNVKVGDRITADNGVQCGVCYNCLNGNFSMCENYTCQGHNLPGGFAQYMKVSAAKCYKLPDSVSFDEACLSELMNCTLSCVQACELKYGDNVVVIGAGSSGNIIAQLLKHSSAGRVIALDIEQAKLDNIAKAGVETVLVDKNDLSKHEAKLREMLPHGADVIIDAAGDIPYMMERVFDLMAPYGRIVFYSFNYFEPKEMKVNPGALIRKGLKITSAPLRMYKFGECVKALADKKIDASLVISDYYKLDDYFEALDHSLKNPLSMKVVIHPNEE